MSMIFPKDHEFEVPESAKPTELYNVEDWLTLIEQGVYDTHAHGLHAAPDRFSPFGLYLDLSGVQWEEHPHSPGTFGPRGMPNYSYALPQSYCRLFGEIGSLYWTHFRRFAQLRRLPCQTQARQLRLYIELDARDKVR